MKAPSRQEVTKGFIDNLGRQRIEMGLTQEQMSKKLDMNIETYRKLERGDVKKIDFYTAVKMYFLTGDLGYSQSGFDVSYGDQIQKFINLSESQKRYIADLIDFEYAFMPNDDNEEDYVTVFIPVGNLQDGMIYDSSNYEKVNIAPYREIFGDKIRCGIKVTSNHLHPAYNIGDILLVSHDPPRHGDVGVFLNKETSRVYIRKMLQFDPCQLVPVCDCGMTITIDSHNKSEMDKWIKFGSVLTKIRK